MANPDQSVQTCLLKVDLKCCTGCQQKASIKLKSISGVTEVEYNSEKGLMTVTGDVEPMALIRKLTKCGKKTELFSVKYQLADDDLNRNSDDEDEDDTSSDSSIEREFQEKMEQQNRTWLPKKPSFLRRVCFLGCCFASKSKVVQPLPMQSRNWHVPSKFENPPPGFSFTTSSQLRPPEPRIPYPPSIQMQQMQQQPHVRMTGAAIPFNVSIPPGYQPSYFMPNQAQSDMNLKPNPNTHYK